MNSVNRAIELIGVITGSNVSAVANASHELEQLQLSADGWTIGDQLLSGVASNTNSAILTFYGALTFQIKLNRQVSSLSIQDAQHIRVRLVAALVRLASSSDGGQAFACRKVNGALATYYMQSPEPWTHALDEIICSMSDIDTISDNADISRLISTMSPAQRLSALNFAALLTEELDNLQGVTPHSLELEKNMRTNGSTIRDLIIASFNDSRLLADGAASEDITKCFALWCSYTHKQWQDDTEAQATISQLLDFMISCLQQSSTKDAAYRAFSLLLDSSPGLLKANQLDSLWLYTHQQVPAIIRDGTTMSIEPVDEEHLAAVKLVPTLALVMIPKLYDTSNTESARSMLGLLQRLSIHTGYPGDEDDLLSPTLAFWLDFAQHAAEQVSDTDEPSTATAKQNAAASSLSAAIRFFIETIRPAAAACFADGTWTKDDHWSQAMEDFYDLLGEVAGLPGFELSDYLIERALLLIKTRDWAELDSILAALIAAQEGGGIPRGLDLLFLSPLLSQVTDRDSGMSPTYARNIIRFVEVSREYFALPEAPGLLQTLESVLVIHRRFAASDADTAMADHAARCVGVLCSSSQAALVASVQPVMLAGFDALKASATTSYQIEKILTGLASIVASVSVHEEQISLLLALLAFVQQLFEKSAMLLSQGDQEQGTEQGVSALKALAAVAKGSQRRQTTAPVIDLSEDSADVSKVSSDGQAGDWSSVQDQILACLNYVSQLQHSGEALAATCAVLKAGLTEEKQGPFVFSPTVISGFLSTMNVAQPRIESLLVTACAFVSAMSRRQGSDILSAIKDVYVTICRVMSELIEPRNDPQIAQLCNDFLEALANHFPSVFYAISVEELLKIFDFVLKSFTGLETMLKRASASMLSLVLTQTGPKRSADLSPELKPHIESIMSQISPYIASSLIDQICGSAQRSELDSIVKVLKAFIVTRPAAKTQLEAAIAQAGSLDTAGGPNVSDAQRRVFIQKVVMLRGGMQTSMVVREFWAACKGTVTSY